jgi:hypothetical protein
MENEILGARLGEKRVGEAIYVKGQRRTVKIDATLHKRVAGTVTVI